MMFVSNDSSSKMTQRKVAFWLNVEGIYTVKVFIIWGMEFSLIQVIVSFPTKKKLGIFTITPTNNERYDNITEQHNYNQNDKNALPTKQKKLW